MCDVSPSIERQVAKLTPVDSGSPVCPQALTQAVPVSGNAFPAVSYSSFDSGPPQLLCLS